MMRFLSPFSLPLLMTPLFPLWRQLLAGALLFGLATAQAAIPIEHWTQPSGAQVFLVHSPSIPMVDVQIDFDAGSRRDPAAQAGLASVTARMAGKGVRAMPGLPALDENELGEAWADLGASFGGGAGADRMSFKLRSLTEPALLQQAAQLAARELGQPAWPAPVWQRERERMNAALAEARTRPGTVAGLAFDHAVYGSHPYGHETTADTLAAIEVADMQAFYAQHVQACRAKVSIVGAVDRAQADALVQQLLGQLPAGADCPPLPAVPEVADLPSAQDIRIDFDGVTVVVDRMSSPYLGGATIDFVDQIDKQGFTIDNPNAAGSCACGDSFH